MAEPGEIVHRLPREPIHLHQLSEDAEDYNNPMGCGAFCTAMALSVYEPDRYGSYQTARAFFQQMFKVPIFGGTFESQNGVLARAQGFLADDYDLGAPDDLAAAIDLGAPVITLINPKTILRIGSHDVLLVGYSTDPDGAYRNFFIDNPAEKRGQQPEPLDQRYPGNQIIPAADLDKRWTGVFTPIFDDAAKLARWRERTRRG